MDNNVKLFRDKMQVLNEEFVEFIQEAFRENPSYDFSPSLTDYLNHVKELDKLYSNSAPKQRKIAVAKRRITPSAAASPKPVEQPKTSIAPTVPEPKKLSNGLVEPAGQFNFAPKVQMPAIPTSAVKAPVFSTPKSTEQQPTPPSLNRKRRQEPLDYNDMLGKSSEDYGKAEPPKKAELPTMPSLFGTTTMKPAAETASNGDQPKSIFGTQSSAPFSFNLKPAAPSDKSSEAEPPKKADPPTMPSLFGNLTKSPAPFSFTMNKPAEITAFGKSSEDSEKSEPPKKADPPKLPSIFGTQSSAPFMFNAKPAAETTTSSASTIPSLFGNLVKSPAPFSFTMNKPAETTAPPTSNGQANGEEEGEAEDAPPPKVEAIKHDEPDAVFSTKCSLFNLVGGEYKKVGVGFLHIKKTESDPQLLIRAATALGTVWVNTRLAGSFKAEKKAKDKIQFSYPSEEGAKTHLVRVVDMEDALAYLTGEKKP